MLKELQLIRTIRGIVRHAFSAVSATSSNAVGCVVSFSPFPASQHGMYLYNVEAMNALLSTEEIITWRLSASFFLKLPSISCVFLFSLKEIYC